MAINFNLLNGPQNKALRGALVAAFRSAEFELLLEDAGFGRLENHARNEAFPIQVQELTGKFARAGILNELMAKVMEEQGQSPALQNLEARLGLLGQMPAKGVDFSGIVRAAIQSGESPKLEAKRIELQKLVRNEGFFDPYLWLALFEESLGTICRISFPIEGDRGHGSGFLVGPDLLLTNYHVVEPVLRGDVGVESVQCVFGYAETGSGVSVGTQFRFAKEWHVVSSRYSDTDIGAREGLPEAGELDFALVRLEGAAGDGKRSWVCLPKKEPQDWKPRGMCIVMQHPRGFPLKHSMGSILASPTPLRVRYDADSAKGSSGGLVVDERAHTIALHHAGDPREGEKAEYNQGIPLYLIRRYIEEKQPGMLP